MLSLVTTTRLLVVPRMEAWSSELLVLLETRVLDLLMVVIFVFVHTKIWKYTLKRKESADDAKK